MSAIANAAAVDVRLYLVVKGNPVVRFIIIIARNKTTRSFRAFLSIYGRKSRRERGDAMVRHRRELQSLEGLRQSL